MTRQSFTMAVIVGVGVQFFGWPPWLLFVIPVFGLTTELALIERWNGGSLPWQRMRARRREALPPPHRVSPTHAARRLF